MSEFFTNLRSALSASDVHAFNGYAIVEFDQSEHDERIEELTEK